MSWDYRDSSVTMSVCYSFVEDLSLVPNTHKTQFTTDCSSRSRRSNTFYRPHRHLHLCTHNTILPPSLLPLSSGLLRDALCSYLIMYRVPPPSECGGSGGSNPFFKFSFFTTLNTLRFHRHWYKVKLFVVNLPFPLAPPP